MPDPAREVDLHYDTGAQLLGALKERDGRQELFIPAAPEEDALDLGEVGTVVAVHLHFADRGVTLRVNARVGWRRARGTTRLPPGLGLTLLDDESGARERLLALARGQELDFAERRRAARYRVDVAVRIAWAGRAPAVARLVDLSETGLCVRLVDAPDAGTPVVVVLPSPLPLPLLTLRVPAHVVWSRRADAGGGAAAMGLHFDHTDKTRRALARVLVKLRKSAVVGGAGADAPEKTD
ncbi:MAG TPA: PilZ domain-containing protein [Myxococcota bacterium]|jgi:Tfp pilus assembly protein PilZ|nr:PilZ domain-containing protein [Myxococcota bacterium]